MQRSLSRRISHVHTQPYRRAREGDRVPQTASARNTRGDHEAGRTASIAHAQVKIGDPRSSDRGGKAKWQRQCIDALSLWFQT